MRGDGKLIELADFQETVTYLGHVLSQLGVS
jgi:hypothetical protein